MQANYAYLNTAFNALHITQSLVHLATQNDLNAQQHSVLLALRFSHDDLKNADLAEIQAFLQQIDDNTIVGLVTDIKTQLHALQCLQLQHAEDVIYATYLKQQSAQTQVLIQTAAPECLSLNLVFSADDAAQRSVQSTEQDLIAGQQILDELKQETISPSQAISQSVEDAVDFIVTAKDPNDEHFWQYFPAISVISVSIAIYQLFQRYQQQQITWQEFKWMAAKISGIKVSKIAAIGLLLGVPVIGQVTGAYLVARLLLNAKATWFEKDAALYRYLQQKMNS